MSIIIVVFENFFKFRNSRKEKVVRIDSEEGRKRNEMNNNVMTFNLIVLKIFPNFVIQKEGERERKKELILREDGRNPGEERKERCA